MNIKNEFKNPQLGDKGLNHRLEYLAEAFSKNNGESISFSCQDWKSSKGLIDSLIMTTFRLKKFSNLT